jgi:nucleotide-binding universal stress UspA family protein
MCGSVLFNRLLSESQEKSTFLKIQEKMGMIKKILVPTDGSAHAGKAFDYAADLSVKYGAELHLIHVVSESKVPEGLDDLIRSERIQDGPRERVFLEKMGDVIIQSLKTKAEQKGIDRLKSEVLSGDPAEKILEYSSANGIDMIVMGSRGLGAIKLLLMGSVSNKVCNLADCTCVTVK